MFDSEFVFKLKKFGFLASWWLFARSFFFTDDSEYYSIYYYISKYYKYRSLYYLYSYRKSGITQTENIQIDFPIPDNGNNFADSYFNSRGNIIKIEKKFLESDFDIAKYTEINSELKLCASDDNEED